MCHSRIGSCLIAAMKNKGRIFDFLARHQRKGKTP
jgi:hypothetical protein